MARRRGTSDGGGVMAHRKAEVGRLDSERYFSVSTVAEWLGVTDVTIKNWSNAGKLDAVRTAGGHRRIAARSVVVMLELQGRAIPRELSDARPIVLLVARERDEIVRHLRKSFSGHARVEVSSDGYAASMNAIRMRPLAIVVDLELQTCDATRFVPAVRAEPTLRDTDIVLIGDARPPRTLLESPDDRGLTYFFRRREHEAIGAAVGAVMRRAATA